MANNWITPAHAAIHICNRNFVAPPAPFKPTYISLHSFQMQWLVWIGFYWSVVYILLMCTVAIYISRKHNCLCTQRNIYPRCSCYEQNGLACEKEVNWQYRWSNTYENLGFFGVWNNKNLFTVLIYLYALKREWSLRSHSPRCKFHNMQSVVPSCKVEGVREREREIKQYENVLDLWCFR